MRNMFYILVLGLVVMKKVIVSLLFVFLATSPAWTLERFDIVTTAELAELLEKRDKGEYDFLLINTLDELISQSASIPGSKRIPHWQLKDANTLHDKSPDLPVITYCLGYR